MPVPKVKSKTAPSVPAKKVAKPGVPPQAAPASNWFYHGVYDAFGIPYDQMQNEASVLNYIYAKLSSHDAELLMRTIRALADESK